MVNAKLFVMMVGKIFCVEQWHFNSFDQDMLIYLVGNIKGDRKGSVILVNQSPIKEILCTNNNH